MTLPEQCAVCEASLVRPGATCAHCATTLASVTPHGDTKQTRSASPRDPLTQSDVATLGPGEKGAGPSRVAGYRILGELGTGGMGSVYRAYDEKMKRPVALKVLSRRLAPSRTAGRRFEQEAWIAGKLDHPNLVKVYDRGTWENLSYFAMELIEGGSLNDVIRNLKKCGRDERREFDFGSRDHVRWAVEQIVAVARGLDHAHRNGVIHRDIKPLNLLLSREQETVKIADFGLAIDADATRLTAAGEVLGTLLYMAPEQLQGRVDEVGVATDIYALAVTLFELLTLELPYKAAGRQQYLAAVLTDEPQRAGLRNAQVPPDLDTVIRKALEKDPAARYGSAADFADDLENVVRFRPINAQAPTRVRRTLKWARRKPIHAALVLVLSLGVPSASFLGHRALEFRQDQRESRIRGLWEKANTAATTARHEEAVAQASELLKLDPDHVKALRLRTITRWKIAGASPEDGRRNTLLELALGDLSRWVVLQPDAVQPRKWQATILADLGREEEASQSRALELEKRSADPSDDELHWDAEDAINEGNYPEAIALLTRLLARSPAKPGATFLRATVYRDDEQPERAMEDFRVAVGLDPTDFYGHYHLGQLATDLWFFDEAETALHNALEIAPESAEVRVSLSNNHLQRGKAADEEGDTETARREFQQAESEARDALALSPSLPWAHLKLADSLMRQAVPRPSDAVFLDAVRHYQTAMDLARSATDDADRDALNPAAMNLCDAWIQTSAQGQALQACQAAVDHFPEDAVALYNLAGVYALLGRTEEALRNLELDIKAGDDDADYLASDPWFESLRDDPRFQNLLERMTAGPS